MLRRTVLKSGERKELEVIVAPSSLLKATAFLGLVKSALLAIACTWDEDCGTLERERKGFATQLTEIKNSGSSSKRNEIDQALNGDPRYMLTEAGKITAQECTEKSGLIDETVPTVKKSQEENQLEENVRRATPRNGRRAQIPLQTQQNIRPSLQQSQATRHKPSHHTSCPPETSVYAVLSRNDRQHVSAELTSSRLSGISSLRETGPATMLMKSGLKRLIYLVGGDVNMIDSTEACKTTMFNTEIADGSHVLRTTDTSDTLKQYGHLTLDIKNRSHVEVGKRGNQMKAFCRTYTEFQEHYKDFDRDRVMDIFCLQLVQLITGKKK